MEAIQFGCLAEIPEELIGGKIVKHDVVNLTAPGENYWSSMLKVDLEVEKNGQKNVVHAVAKCLPAFLRPMQRGMALLTMKNEIGMYNVVIPLFKKFQRENGVPEADFFTKVYFSKMMEETATSRNSLLIFENLITRGFKNEDRYIGCDLQTSKAILQRLAIFHATFIGIKLQKPDDYKEKVKPYTEFAPKPPPPPPNGSTPNGEPIKGPPEMPPNLMTHKNIQDLVLSDPETAKFLDELIEIGNINPFLGDGSPVPEPWATVIHSDFWVNNIMVKHVPGEETQVKFVDFQMCNYKAFVADLMFFIFTSVRNEVQLNNYVELLRCYYDHFTQTLKDLKLGISLTYEEYMDLIRKEGKIELNHATFFTSIIFAKKGGDKDLMNDEEFDHFEHLKEIHSGEISKEQKAKIISIIKLAIRIGILS